jgi:hypothetical protein
MEGDLKSVEGTLYAVEYLSNVPGATWKCGPLGDMKETCLSFMNRNQGQARVIVKNGGSVTFR